MTTGKGGGSGRSRAVIIVTNTGERLPSRAMGEGEGEAPACCPEEAERKSWQMSWVDFGVFLRLRVEVSSCERGKPQETQPGPQSPLEALSSEKASWVRLGFQTEPKSQFELAPGPQWAGLQPADLPHLPLPTSHSGG